MSFAKIIINIKGESNSLDTIRFLRHLKENYDNVIEDIDFEVD